MRRSAIHQINHLHLTEEVNLLLSDGSVVEDGVTIVFGPEKQHKTFYVLQMALCCCMGKPFLGIDTTEGNVLFISFEGSLPYLLERLDNMAETLFPSLRREALGRIAVVDMRGQFLTSEMPKVKSLIKECEPRYCIIDPLTQAITEDFSFHGVANRFMGTLGQLSHDNSAGMIVVMHSRKKPQKLLVSAFEEVLGSRMWVSNAAAIIALGSVNRRGIHQVDYELRYAPYPGAREIFFNSEIGLFELPSNEMMKEGIRAERFILELLQANRGTMRWNELRRRASATAEVHPGTVDSARFRLEVSNKIKTERIKGSAAKIVFLQTGRKGLTSLEEKEGE